ncbi:MAG: hypothetical protein JNK15_12585 [Planctomycetes bacterium]|nr:hypothetical protein [Planctomycetota bacterium]
MKTILLWLSLPVAALPAQKANATLVGKPPTLEIRYESLPVGEHSLAELGVGKKWRLGSSHDASTLQTSTPLLAGDAWIAPGCYRVQLYRDSETSCSLWPEGAEHALLQVEPIRIAGKLGTLPKPAAHLAIELRPQGQLAPGKLTADVELRFGADQWLGSVVVLGSEVVALPGAQLTTFRVPASRLGQGPVPIATLQQNQGNQVAARWNVLWTSGKVRLVPWREPPATNFGRIDPIDPGAVLECRVTSLPFVGDQPLEVLELREPTLERGELRWVVAFGTTRVECRVQEPALPKPKPTEPQQPKSSAEGGR